MKYLLLVLSYLPILAYAHLQADSLVAVASDQQARAEDRVDAMLTIAYELSYEYDSALVWVRQAYALATTAALSKETARCDLAFGCMYANGRLDSLAIMHLGRCLSWATSFRDEALRVQALYQWGKLRYLQSKLSAARDTLELSLELAVAGAYHRVAMLAHNMLGAVSWEDGDYQAAATNFQASIGIAEKEGLRKSKANYLSNLGELYAEQGDYPRGVRCFTEALRIMETDFPEENKAGFLEDLGYQYLIQYEPEQAMTYLRRALQETEAFGDAYERAAILSSIGRVHQYVDQFDSARASLKESLVLYQHFQDQPSAAIVMLDLGDIAYDQGLYEEALSYHEQALGLLTELGYEDNKLDAYLLLGKTLNAMEDHEQAIGWAQQALTQARASERTDEAMKAHRLLAQSYLASRQYDKAALTYQAYIKLRDQFDEEGADRELFRQQYQYAYEKQALSDSLAFAQEALSLERQVQAQRTQRNTFLVATLVALLIGGFFAWNYRQKQRTNQVLTQKNQTIAEALDEREALLKEIHHRVKNNLQVVSSLLSLQSRNLTDQAAQRALQEGQNRVHAMALIHRQLYQNEQLTTIDVPSYFEDLISTLVTSYQVNPQQIRIIQDIQADRLDVDTLIPLGLIMNELISNALKYAFVGQDKGQIHFTVHDTPEELLVEVKDNGVGLPKGFDVERPTSMGFKLVQAFANKMKGVLQTESVAGTQVRLLIPHDQADRV